MRIRRPPYKQGEKYTNRYGYVMVKHAGHPRTNHKGFVPEHVLVLETKIGRFLISEEVVHHRNFKPGDNRIENLRLFENQAEHLRFHRSLVKKTFCLICGAPHFGKGFCLKHYNSTRRQGGYRAFPCDGCGKTIYQSHYVSKDGKHLCRKCRWPAQTCTVCGKPGFAKSLCPTCYAKSIGPPCSKCGKQVRKGGRNHWPPLCWDCRFPKQVCKICGGKHEALGLCENHYKQLKRGTLKVQDHTSRCAE